ncbi:hypothetical protein SFC43_12950 [Bacteroides sp. CR5/BHMF/2]|nr:hypothetical protein [Bacteroides sp. CR5/BHMF/2]
MQTVSDLLNELTEQYLVFINYTVENGYSNQANLSSFKSLSIGLWHIHEWIWKESPRLRTRFSNFSRYRECLFNKCSELKIMHDIANMSKHSILERNKSDFKELGIHEGNSLSSEDLPFVKVIMNDGQFYNGTKLLDKIFQFWCDFVQDLRLEDI